ncbi:uncharacterized protein TRUGW13939_09695 [Talaromyces rugulosus]|uniref:GH18 domain-containing protein n=1 Tax=Talaromyces rugulosus TaxID=121627 RepID=A0A7H8R810_TALRU|nr:uncharacterized protein TRUGW13939_09695 [Talaromyces rugulosus]QKX62534.1 hypothetical protein TRUGW13939_09695 [Talaromyces rugulosus]
MHFSTTVNIFSLVATAVSATSHISRSNSSAGEVAVYWGQNGGNTVENNDLSSYCAPDSGVDIIILSFLYEYGNSNSIPSGTIGQSCSISLKGEPSNCDDLASAIETCKSHGVKIILSLGGGSGAYSLQSQAEAEAIGQNLWDAYGNTSQGNIPRPFGKTFVDGWDFDIEKPEGSQYYQYLISVLRSNFASDPSHVYYISGAPQCPLNEPYMRQAIQEAVFDYLWVQFYNNDDCSHPNPINYNDWVDLITTGSSAAAKVFIGVPASTKGANGKISGEKYYMSPSDLAITVTKYTMNSHWGGIMLWDAGFSDANVIGGCTYAQQSKNILNKGSPCSGSGTGTTVTNAPSRTSSLNSTSFVTGPFISQWGQVSVLFSQVPTNS